MKINYLFKCVCTFNGTPVFVTLISHITPVALHLKRAMVVEASLFGFTYTSTGAVTGIKSFIFNSKIFKCLHIITREGDRCNFQKTLILVIAFWKHLWHGNAPSGNTTHLFCAPLPFQRKPLISFWISWISSAKLVGLWNCCDLFPSFHHLSSSWRVCCKMHTIFLDGPSHCKNY